MNNATPQATETKAQTWIEVGRRGIGAYEASVTDGNNYWGFACGSTSDLAAKRLTEMRTDIGWSTPTEVRDVDYAR